MRGHCGAAGRHDTSERRGDGAAGADQLQTIAAPSFASLVHAGEHERKDHQHDTWVAKRYTHRLGTVLSHRADPLLNSIIYS